MEEWSVRAIIISVSIFIGMMTLSIFMMYYERAKLVADSVSSRTNIAEVYDLIMNGEDLEETEMTGAEVRSFISKYLTSKDDENKLQYVKVEIIDNTHYSTVSVGTSWLNNIGNVSEEKLDLINPIWKYKVNKYSSGVIFEIV